MQKLHKTFTNESGTLVAKVYRDVDYGEYVVKFYRDGVHQVRADYHTDKCDAMGTAQRFVDGKDCGTCGGFEIGKNQMSPVQVVDASRAALAAEAVSADFLENIDAQNLLPGRYMPYDEYYDLIGPLVRAGIAFDLAIPDCVVARLMWNGGDAVENVYSSGFRAEVKLFSPLSRFSLEAA